MKNNIGTKILHIDKANYTPIATVKQEDNITMTLELYKEGVEFDITRQTVTLAAKRSDKVIIEQIDGFTINNNTLTINLKNNIIAKIGLVYLELTFKDESGSMTTLDFYLKVNGKILGEDSLDASDNIASLEKIQQDFINSSSTLLENVTENENIRAQAEKARKVNEETRNKIETSRANAETKRVEAENSRKTAETDRVEAEKLRAAADAIRDKKIKDIGSQCTENTNQIDNAAVGFDGKEHSSLKHRLDADYMEVKEQFNANSYLPFEGEDVTVEHSLDGVTKDMEIRGRTLQNLFPIIKVNENAGLTNCIYTKKADGYINLKLEDTTSLSWLNVEMRKGSCILKPNTKYTIVVDVGKNTLSNHIDITHGVQYQSFKELVRISKDTIGVIKQVITTKEDLGANINADMLIACPNGTTGDIDLRITLLEGETQYIPAYFEGIKSVGEEDENKISILSTGKNLVNYKDFNLDIVTGVAPSERKNVFKDGYVEVRSNSGSYNPEVAKIPVKRNTNYYFCIKHDNSYGISLGNAKPVLYIYNSDLTLLKHGYGKTEMSFNSGNNNFMYVGFNINKSDKVPLNEFMKVYDIAITEGTYIPEYKAYEADKKEILLVIENGLKSLPNGACDTIENRENGTYIIQRIGKCTFNGSEGWNIANDNSYIYMSALDYNYANPYNAICDSLKSEVDAQIDKTIYITASTWVIINRQYTTLEEYKTWLQVNPVTVYYELAEPIKTKVDIPSLNMKTFNEGTHIYFENLISPNAKFKAPVNVTATISSLRTRNESLEQENKELKEEVSVKTLKLHGQDVELTNSDLDLDFRIFELEMSIGLPINLNMKGMRNMARSPFEMMKILILNNNYDREDIEYKAKRYLQGGRMTQAEYDEIISLMDANEIIK